MANYDRRINGKEYLQCQFWLVFTDSASAPRLTVREPSLHRDERAMFMDITLPKSLWATPSLTGKVLVEDPGLSPVTIDGAALASAVRQAIGMDVEIKVIPPTAPDEDTEHEEI